MWEEAGVPEESPRVQAFDHHILSRESNPGRNGENRVSLFAIFVCECLSVDSC